MWIDSADEPYDVVMLGTFAVWRLGTLQARALPMAIELRRRGLRVALVTTPWDMPAEAGTRDIVGGVPVVNTRHVTQAAVALAVREQLDIVRKLHARLVHVFKPRGVGGLAATVLIREGRTPVVVDADDWEGDGGWNQLGGYNIVQRRVFQWQEQSLLRDAHAVTAASSLLAERAAALRNDRPWPRERVRRMPNGLPAERVARFAQARANARELSSSDSPPVVLLYSRMAEFGSGWLPRFVAALERVVDCEVCVAVVGSDGAQHACTSGRVTVKCLGYIPVQAIPSTLASAAVAVVPVDDTLVGRSRQSVKLLELMAAGCPVVASRVGDIRETLADAGCIVTGAEPDVFAREVDALLRSSQRLAAMGAAGPARVQSKYLMERIVDDVMDLYADIGLTTQ
jgi:glycosyltransferase involved in cell wall biosynthesis